MIRAAIVGLGWWGKVLVDAAAESTELRFTTAVVRDPQRCREYASARNLGFARDYAAALADSAVDAVVLATPHTQHVEQIAAAAAAGKAVFSEKPLALDLVSAKRAIDACRDAGVVLGLGNDKRFLPAVLELVRLAEAGSLGEIVHVEGQYSNDNSAGAAAAPWRERLEETPAGGMTGPGLHALDVMLLLAGAATRVDAQFCTRAPPPRLVDVVTARLSFADGATGSLATVRGVPEYFRLHAFGTAGMAEVRGFDTLIHSPRDGPPRTLNFWGELAVGVLLDHFARAVSGTAAFPVSTASMLATVAAFEAVVASIRTGGPVAVQDTAS